MKINRIVFIVLAVVVAAGFVATFMTSSSQTQNKTGQTKTGEDIPIVDIYAPEPDDPLTKDLQRNRSKKYDTGIPIKDDFEPYPEILELPLSHAPVEPALPVTQSDAIAIGMVTDGKAFLSNDWSNVYCEFTVRVEQALKNTGPFKLSTDSDILAERIGGRLRFSSGKIQLRGRYGRRMPVKGQQYLFFLNWSDSGKDFVILTGYEMQNGKVIPLDSNTKDSNLSVYENYDALRDKKIEDIIKQVKALMNPSSSEVRDK